MKLISQRKKERGVEEVLPLDEDFPHLDNESGHESWAVSYADLLMVILSFFVIFFSIDEGQQEERVLTEITSFFHKSEKSLGKNPATNMKGDQATAALPIISQVHNTIKDFGVEPRFEKSSLIITFKSNIFRKGSFVLEEDEKEHVIEVFKKLAPFSKDITLTLIGHSDQEAVKSKSRFMQDNFELSSLRATHALRLARSVGFPETQLFASGAGPNLVDSRTISIKIEQLGSGK